MATLTRKSSTRSSQESFRIKGLLDDPYPYSDGKPLAESEPHMRCIRWLLDAIEDVMRGKENVAYHGDMFWYWEKGNFRATRAPDVFVLFGVPMDFTRLSYKSWEYGGIVPSVIIETASKEQKKLLLGELRRDYERLGVNEYFAFDWSGKYLKKPLYGFRLRDGKYQALRPATDGSMLSQALGMKLRPEGKMLRLINPEDGQPIPARAEALAAEQAETRRLKELLRKAGIDPTSSP